MRVAVRLLGGFSIAVDGIAVPDSAWSRRDPTALVKLLAHASGRRLHRERVLDALWPDLDGQVALPRLHKAAHHARRALGTPDGVTLRASLVQLLPGADVVVDADEFETAARRALRARPPSATDCRAVADLFVGDFLPDDVTETWADEPRQRLRGCFERLMHASGDDQGDAAGATRPSLHAVSPTDARASRPVFWHETLLERDEELTALRRIVGSVLRNRRGMVVCVSGEAGSGKSSLIRALLSTAPPDLTVAAGGCDDLLAPRSLGPFRDMLDAEPALGPLLSGAGGPDDVLPGLFRILTRRPTLLVLEDVHWADDATLDAIRYLCRRIAAIPSVVVLSFRADEVDLAHPLRRILAGTPSDALRRIPLPPLSIEAVARLAGIDRAAAEDIHRVTRGNPFFVTEIIAGDDPTTVPATVTEAVLARVGRLPPDARDFVQRLAVVPNRAERALAEALAGGSADIVALAERSGVLSGSTDHVAFRHEIARRAVDSSLTAGDALQAHRAVLTALLTQTDVDAARVVHHAARAARVDLLVRWAPIAADEAERAGAHRQAAESLRAALRYADRLDTITRAKLFTRCAYSLYIINEYESALPEAESAVSCAEQADDPAALVDALVVLSRISMFARGPTVARVAAGRALAVVGTLSDPVRHATTLIEVARVHSNLATIGIVAEPSGEVVRVAERAHAIAAGLSRTDLRVQALCYRGSGRLALNDDRGSDDLETAIALSADEPRLEIRVRAYVNAAHSAYRAGRHQDARNYVATGLRLAADGEFAAGEYRLHLTSAGVAASTGDWHAAITELRALFDSPGDAGVMALLARALLVRLLARRDDPDHRAVLREALDHPLARADSYVAGPLAVAAVESAWLDGPLTHVPSFAARALRLSARANHLTMYAELCGYLRRAGLRVAAPADLPGPWAASLTGRWERAAASWERLGERYEQAVELLRGAPDGVEHQEGLRVLTELGATATVRRHFG